MFFCEASGLFYHARKHRVGFCSLEPFGAKLSGLYTLWSWDLVRSVIAAGEIWSFLSLLFPTERWTFKNVEKGDCFLLNFSFKITWNNVCQTSNTFVHHTIKLKHKESDECPARMSHSLTIQMVWRKKKHITIGRLSFAWNCTSFLRSVSIHTRALIFQHGTEMRNEDE